MPERHILADWIEHTPPPNLPGIVYCRAALTGPTLRSYPTALAWHWSVGRGHFGADLGERLDAASLRVPDPTPAFVGWQTPGGKTRSVLQQACDSVVKTFDTRATVRIFEGFHGHRAADTETRRREVLFTDAMQNHLFQLAPASAPGVLRYRVFEALRAGRIPVIIDDEIVLPRNDAVPWESVSIHIPTAAAEHTGEVIRRWLDLRNDSDLAEARALARGSWLEFFDGDRNNEHFAAAARQFIMEKVGPR